MKPLPSHKQSLRRRFASVALVLAFAPSLCFAAAPIRLAGPGSVTLPSVTVAATPQTVQSGDLVLQLDNKNDNSGWLLSASILNDELLGDTTSAAIPAYVSFKSITWISGGNGSTAGITLFPDGKTIEANPGFGKGVYNIVFEIRYDVPAFPRTDTYRGVTTFSLL